MEVVTNPLVGETIVQLAGRPIGSEPNTGAFRYTALIETESGTVYELAPDQLTRLEGWPEISAELPVQDFGLNVSIVGDRVEAVCLRVRKSINPQKDAENQVFVVLSGGMLAGMMWLDGGGTKLVVEDAASSPLVLPNDDLRALNGSAIELRLLER